MRLTDSQRRRLWLAALASLLAHALLLSMALSGAGAGTPGLGLTWRDRRVEAKDVRVVMVPARVAPAPPAATPMTPQANPEKPGTVELNTAPAVPSEPLAPAATAAASPDPTPIPAATPPAKAVAEVAAAAETAPVTPAGDPTARLGTVAPARPAAADRIALDPSRQTAWAVPVEAPLPIAMTAIAPAASASGAERALLAPRAAKAEVLARITPIVRERAVDLTQLDSSAQEAGRQIEQLQTSSAEAARLEAAREQAARELAVRQEAAKQEAARQEAARIVAAQADADTARREAARRAMGRQLDEEAARRREAESAAAAIAVPPVGSAAVRQAAPLPLSWSSARRGRLLGRVDPNAELVLYAEAFARKIQLNLTMDQVREAVQQRHASPLVTVAIRQDGSVESVTFVVSSGVPLIDEAIRRIVQGQAPYPAFSPALARDFDVIEIRRTWTFDTAVRLY